MPFSGIIPSCEYEQQFENGAVAAKSDGSWLMAESFVYSLLICHSPSKCHHYLDNR